MAEFKSGKGEGIGATRLQGYLAHKKQPPPLGPPWDPRYSPHVGTSEGAVSYEQGTPATSAGKALISMGTSIQIEKDPVSSSGFQVSGFGSDLVEIFDDLAQLVVLSVLRCRR